MAVASERVVCPVEERARHKVQDGQDSPHTTQVESEPKHRSGLHVQAFLSLAVGWLHKNKRIDPPEWLVAL